MNLPSKNFQKYYPQNPLKKYFLDNFLKKLQFLATENRPASILDLGCGEGVVMNYLRESLPQSYFVGIDISAPALEIAQSLNPDAEFHKISLYDLSPLYKKRFDLVLCLETLEHLQEPDRALNQITRVSTKEVIISVPDEPLFSLLAVIYNLPTLSWEKISQRDLGHVQHFSMASLKKLVNEHLRVVSTYRPPPWLLIKTRPKNDRPSP